VTFDIIKPAENNDKSCIVLGGKHRPYFPQKVSIPVNRKAKRLFFLISAAWCGKESGKAADIHINYQGGAGLIPRRTLPLMSGTNIADWTASDISLPKAEIAWRKVNPDSNLKTSVFLIEWKNPEPDIEITHIDFVSGGIPVPVLFAVTGEVFE